MLLVVFPTIASFMVATTVWQHRNRRYVRDFAEQDALFIHMMKLEGETVALG